MISFNKLLFNQFKIERILIARQIRHVLNSSLIFLMILLFIPLAIPPEAGLLKQVAPGLVWVALLFALLISAERLFQTDYEEGVLEQWMVSGYSLPLFVSTKLMCHWFFTVIPIVCLSSLVYLFFNFNGYETLIVMIGLLLGSPALLYLCALSSVFSGGLQQKGVFMALILLPLTIPIMIFGSGSATIALQGLPVTGYLSLLLALSILSVGLLPYAISAMIRISLVD